MCLPCLKPDQYAKWLNEMMEREPGTENDVVEICEILSEFLREIVKAHEAKLNNKLYAKDVIVDNQGAAKAITRKLPAALAQANPCLIFQVVLQILAALFGQQSADNFRKNLTTDPKLVEFLVKLFLFLLQKEGIELPPIEPPPTGPPGYVPSDEERC